MSLGVSAADMAGIISDIGSVVGYYSATRTIDPIYGTETVSLATVSSKTWVFFKKTSDIELKKWGVVDIGDAYVIVPTTETINYGDRITFNSETYEYTPDCKGVERYIAQVYCYKYYSLRKVA
jgi:hypothetical protein